MPIFQTIRPAFRTITIVLSICCLSFAFTCPARGDGGLAEVRARGELRHLGVPYANFVTGSGDGFSVELMQRFAEHLGVKYRFVESDFASIIPDLTGERKTTDDQGASTVQAAPVKGDVISTGFTVLAWREKLVSFATPTFPNQIWLMTPANSDMTPIQPSGDIEQDIQQVKQMVRGRTVMGKNGTCIDLSLYKMAETGAVLIDFPGNLNHVMPAVMSGEADATILDVPDALVAMSKWPGEVKVIGPISKRQTMAEAFRQNDTALKEAYETFLAGAKKDGTYMKLIRKYYPDVLYFFSDFFEDSHDSGN